MLGILPASYDSYDDEPATAAPAAPPKAPKDQTARGRLVEALQEYDDQLALKMSPTARASLMRARDACAERLARVDGVLVTEATICRHPIYLRIIHAHLDALCQHPLAAQDVRVIHERMQSPEHADELEAEYRAWRERYASLVDAVEIAERVLLEACGGGHGPR